LKKTSLFPWDGLKFTGIFEPDPSQIKAISDPDQKPDENLVSGFWSSDISQEEAMNFSELSKLLPYSFGLLQTNNYSDCGDFRLLTLTSGSGPDPSGFSPVGVTIKIRFFRL